MGDVTEGLLDHTGSASEPEGPKRYCRGTFSYVQCITVSVLLSLGMVALGLYLFSPLIVQPFIDESSISFSQMKISSGHSENMLLMKAVTEVSSVPIRTKFLKSSVNFRHNEKSIGSFEMESFIVESGTSQQIEMNGVLTVTDVSGFQKFSEEMLMNKTVQWGLHGTVRVSPYFGSFIWLPYGVSFSKNITVPGSAGLTNVTVQSYDLFEAPSGQTMFRMAVRTFNPGVSEIDCIGNLSINSFYEGKLVGFGVARDVKIVQGWNTLQVTGPLQPETQELTNFMFSQYMDGLPTPITANGVGATNTLFDYAIRSLHLHLDLPGAPSPAIDAIMQADFNPGLRRGGMKLHAYPVMLNNLGIPISMFECDMNITFSRKVIGHSEMSKLNYTLRVPPHVQQFILPSQIVIPDPGNLYVALQLQADLKEGFVGINVTGKYHIAVGSLNATVNYSQNNIRCCLCSHVDQCRSTVATAACAAGKITNSA
eukprot:147434_1